MWPQVFSLLARMALCICHLFGLSSCVSVRVCAHAQVCGREAGLSFSGAVHLVF